MKKLIASFFIILTAQLFNGCAETNIQHISPTERIPESNNFHANYSNVWRATIHALSENEIIKTMDEGVGVVVTEYSTVDNTELDAIKTALFAKTFKYSYTVNLNKVTEATTSVKINVKLLSTQIGFYQREQSHLDVESYLRKNLFTRIYNKLGPNHSKNHNEIFSHNFENQYRRPPGSLSSSSDPYAKKIQQSLSAAGYDPGAQDGIIGEKTIRALRQYQKDKQLPVTGTIDDDTLMSLGIFERGKTVKTVKIASKESVDEHLHDEPFETARGESNKLKDSNIAKKESIPMINEQEMGKEEKTANKKEISVVISRGVILDRTSMVSQASIMADPIDEIPTGSTVDIIEKQNNFYKVRYKGKEGFVYSSFIKEKNKE